MRDAFRALNRDWPRSGHDKPLSLGVQMRDQRP